jgi:hypothetical protein
MATKSKQPRQPFGGLVANWAPKGNFLGSGPFALPTKTKPKKKRTVKPAVSVEPNGHHKDMMGRLINQGDYVLAVQNNRPFPFKVLKLNATSLTVVPAIKRKDITHRAMGGSIPAYKNYRREGWNVYLIPKEEIFMYNLTGNVTL